ncbi:MAG: hypothetical protein WC829_02845 [Hyphomicrobium sp.]|jgi:hypothetical protein
MSGDEIDMKEWGILTQMVAGLVDGHKEVRDELKLIRAAVGTRCTDCAPGASVKAAWTKVEGIETRLRYLEIKVAGIAVVSGVASAVITHMLTKALG